MRRWLLLLTCGSGLINEINAAQDTVLKGGLDSKFTLLQPLYALIDRQLPGHHDSFIFDYSPRNTSLYEQDRFELASTVDSKIQISCNTLSSCCRGLYT